MNMELAELINQNYMENHFLSEDRFRTICPMAYMEKPTNPDVSTGYVVANTKTIVDDMAKLGWFPVNAWQQRRHVNSKYSFHSVVFENPDLINDNEYYPRLILTNSHDGMHAFRFYMALYKKSFGNSLGIIINFGKYEKLYIRHISYTLDELRELTNTVANDSPSQLELIKKMRATTLTVDQKREFAVKMFKIRRSLPMEIPFMLPDDIIAEILGERWKESDSNLWEVFEWLQFALINGGFTAANERGKKTRKLRLIKSAAKNIYLSRKLFTVAASFVEE